MNIILARMPWMAIQLIALLFFLIVIHVAAWNGLGRGKSYEKGGDHDVE